MDDYTANRLGGEYSVLSSGLQASEPNALCQKLNADSSLRGVAGKYT